jgi:large subunit ribosomal protein L6
MSRIGKNPVTIPSGITVTQDKTLLVVKGPKGELSLKTKRTVGIEVTDGSIIVTRKAEHKRARAMHGTTRNLIHNMIKGVSEGFQKDLKLVGVGYRVKLEGKNLNLSLGLSHPVKVEAVAGIEFKVEGQNKLSVIGIDKQLVGQIAANIRRIRPPEPYKGKGIRYTDERIIKKAGKTGKAE